MTRSCPGRFLRYRVDWLEMRSPPESAPVPVPPGEDIFLAEAEEFPPWFFFAMYDAVGRDYEWEDMHLAPRGEVEGFLGDSKTRMFTMMRHGWPQGFFVLDARAAGICGISCFGLVEQAVGKGLGGWLLDQAVNIGWGSEGVRKMTVNTCTLDHPHARKLYEGRGFRLVASEDRRRMPATRRSRVR